MLEAQVKELTQTQDRHLARIREITSQTIRSLSFAAVCFRPTIQHTHLP